MAAGYIPPVPDFDFITPRLAVGARTGEDSLHTLRSKGITHILAIDTYPPAPVAAEYGITIFSHPFPDDLQEKPPSLLLAIARDALKTLNRLEPVLLVTCGAGMYRAPMVTLLILRLLGFSQAAARNLITSRRWGTGFPRSYVESVEQAVEAWWHAARNGRPR